MALRWNKRGLFIFCIQTYGGFQLFNLYNVQPEICKARGKILWDWVRRVCFYMQGKDGRKKRETKKTSWNMYCFAIFPTGWSQCDWLFDSRLERCLFVGPCLVWCGAKPGRDKFEVDKVLSVFVRTFRNGAILISGTAGDLYVVREKSWNYWYSIVFILLNRGKKGLTNAFELLHNLVYTGPCDLSWNCVY